MTKPSFLHSRVGWNLSTGPFGVAAPGGLFCVMDINLEFLRYLCYNIVRSQLVKDMAGFPNGSRRVAENSFAPGVDLFFCYIVFKLLDNMFRIFFYFAQYKFKSGIIIAKQIGFIYRIRITIMWVRLHIIKIQEKAEMVFIESER